MPYKYTKAFDYRGSSMGRPDYYGDKISPCKLHLERVRLDNGGYDRGGAYWGTGAPLFVAYGYDETEVVEIFTRATNRETAKTIIKSMRKNVSFYR